jgi:hypothetical protein
MNISCVPGQAILLGHSKKENELQKRYTTLISWQEAYMLHLGKESRKSIGPHGRRALRVVVE